MSTPSDKNIHPHEHVKQQDSPENGAPAHGDQAPQVPSQDTPVDEPGSPASSSEQPTIHPDLMANLETLGQNLPGLERDHAAALAARQQQDEAEHPEESSLSSEHSGADSSEGSPQTSDDHPVSDSKSETSSTHPSEGVSAEDDEEEEEEDEEEESSPASTLRGHLIELRKRLFLAFLMMLGGFACCLPFADILFGYLQEPVLKLLPPGSSFMMTGLPEGFIVEMKVSFVAGIFLASPLIFYQLWAFIAPGLYREEKLFIIPVALLSALFFIAGATFCYKVAFPAAFEFFLSYSSVTVKAMLTLKEYLSLTLTLLLAFGLIFELPLVIFFLARMGIVTADMMRRFRRYAIVCNVIVAAILTPPDVFSQILMAGPLLVLYEISILVAAMFGKKKKAEQEPEASADAPAENTKSHPPSAHAEE